MDEKLNIQELSALFAQRSGVKQEKAEQFVREFFAQIEDALEKDKYVKIKGFGVFKLIEMGPRESVNIQTKERFEIPGYTKVSFTPDPSLRDIINKPFAHFETVILHEHTVFDDKKEEPENQPSLADENREVAFSEENENGKREEETKAMPVYPINSRETRNKRLRQHLFFKRIVLVFLVALIGAIGFFAYSYWSARQKISKPKNTQRVEVDTLLHQVEKKTDSIRQTISEQTASKKDTILWMHSRTPL